MWPTLAIATLVRHRARTLLGVLGVAVSTAMLLDMVMLATGMRVSFRTLILSRGFQLRLAPKGTLPFDTEATIPGLTAILGVLRANPSIVTASPVLGGQLHASAGDRVIASVALGIEPAEQGDYQVTGGHDILGPDQVVASADFLAAMRAKPGDTIDVAAGYDAQLRVFTGRRRLAVAGVAHFIYLAEGERAVAVPIRTLQAMEGPRYADRASLIMVKARGGADVESVRRWIARAEPNVSVISTETAMRQVDERLSYFRQLAFILGTISLFVGFLLVTTLVTVSVNERLGEIAVLRAIGIVRSRIVLQIVAEGTVIMVSGAVMGLALGLVTARYLNSILSSFPGLPAAINFFLFQPRDAWIALGMITAAGIVAGVYPAWRGSSLPIATTLREEAVA